MTLFDGPAYAGAGRLLDHFRLQEYRNYIRHCGYAKHSIHPQPAGSGMVRHFYLHYGASVKVIHSPTPSESWIAQKVPIHYTHGDEPMNEE